MSSTDPSAEAGSVNASQETLRRLAAAAVLAGVCGLLALPVMLLAGMTLRPAAHEGELLATAMVALAPVGVAVHDLTASHDGRWTWLGYLVGCLGNGVAWTLVVAAFAAGRNGHRPLRWVALAAPASYWTWTLVTRIGGSG